MAQRVAAWQVAPVHPGDRHYRNQALRVSDLVVTDHIVRGVTFENCVLMGPAVIALLGQGSVTGCNLEGSLDAVLWPVAGDRGEIVGAIGFEDCSLVGCSLRYIGFAVPEDQLASFRAGFGG
jgi:hypothetical protein